MKERRLVMAVTGASGIVYAERFLRAVVDSYDRIFVIISDNARIVIRTEMGYSEEVAAAWPGDFGGKVQLLSPSDMAAQPASGSFSHEGMVVIPCSMGTVGRIASGVSNDLITRAADVCLKERRPLLMVVRETPLSLIHLRNMTVLTEAGATIFPAAPSFYNCPETIADLVDTVVARVMQHLGLVQSIVPEWEMK